MRKISHETHTLIEPQKALRVYLDALLCESTFSVESETQIKEEQESSALEKVPDELPDVGRGELSTKNAGKVATEIFQPDWAQERFQCLSFQVAGVTLAAPLEKLHGIVELDEAITELPGYAPWVMGLLPNRGQNVQVVDIAEIIMPDERRIDERPAAERTKYLVLVDGGKFGLAADSISQVLTLEPEDVHWRSLQSRRPWLAGTLVSEMCALLEVDELCVQLQKGLKSVG